MAKQDDYVRYTIRVPREIYADIEQRANTEQRSVNAEIIQRLSDSIDDRPADGFVPLKVNIEESVYNTLVADTFIYDFTLSEYVNDIFKRENNYILQYKTANEEIMDARSDIYRLEKELKELKIRESNWKNLYKSTQLSGSTFVDMLELICLNIQDSKDSVPESLNKISSKILQTVDDARRLDALADQEAHEADSDGQT